jgi:hypothetical protein
MPRYLLLPLLCLATSASLELARAMLRETQSFSCAISTYTLKAGDAPYDVCTINADPVLNAANFLSMQWFTGTFDKPYGSESVLISM